MFQRTLVYGVSNLTKKPSFFEFALSIVLALVVSTVLDGTFPDLNIIIHFAAVLIISSLIWSKISVYIEKVKRRAEILHKHGDYIDELIERGESFDGIVKKVNARMQEEKGQKPTGPVLDKIKVTIKEVGRECGYYNNEPIFETLEMTDGSIYEFDCVLRPEQENNISSLDKTSIIFPNGFVYKLKSAR